jgi:hypothetical protein
MGGYMALAMAQFAGQKQEFSNNYSAFESLWDMMMVVFTLTQNKTPRFVCITHTCARWHAHEHTLFAFSTKRAPCI